MKKYFVGCLWVALLMSACGNEDRSVMIYADPDQVRPGGTDNCTDDCQIDDIICDEEGTHFCGHFDSDPCLDLSQGIKCDCGCDGSECKKDCPIVEEKCSDNCTVSGDTKCSGIQLQKCEMTEDGCLQWTEPESCGEGKHCDLGECKDGIVEVTCDNACTEGKVECTDIGRRKCKLGNDGCTEWTDEDPCNSGEICNNGECSVPKEDACELGKKECNGNGVRECITGSDGYTVWGNVTNCQQGQICKNNACEKQITDECELNKKECVNNGFRECKTASSGYTEWSAVTPCGDKQKCERGACVDKCKDACSSGAKKCASDGSGYYKCTTGSDGCLAWSTSLNKCDYGCDSGNCKPNPNDWIPACSSNCPVVIDKFPYVVTHDNSGDKNVISTYNSSACGTQDESGPEKSYIFRVKEPGYLIAGVTDKGSKDVDIHLLSSLKASDCLARDDRFVMKHINAGIYYLTVDSYNGAASAGKYQLAVQFLADSGKCGLKPTSVARVGNRSTVNLPAIGNVVLEAHLVTVHDRTVKGKNWWPSSFTDYISEHRAYTKSLYPDSVSTQTEPWCPSGEGDCQYGQGSVVNAVPDDAEAWYVCMYWTGSSRPKAGTRFLVLSPFNGKAVVAAAGYETGPGDGDKIGGAVDEIHHYLGTANDSPRRIMFSQMIDANQSLPFGPITCTY